MVEEGKNCSLIIGFSNVETIGDPDKEWFIRVIGAKVWQEWVQNRMEGEELETVEDRLKSPLEDFHCKKE